MTEWNESYKDYLKDESGLEGTCKKIAFPASLDELKSCLQEKGQFTIQGSRTGIMGGASPFQKDDNRDMVILNLTHLQKIGAVSPQEEGFFITAESGALLQDIQACLGKEHMFFPVEPTEETATIGGAFACNAKGLTSLKYGSCREHVVSLQVLTPDHTLLTIPRNKYFFTESGCPLPKGGFLPCRPLLEKRDRIPLLPHVGMDLIDLFAGSEGTLGVFVSLKLKAVPIPPVRWSLVFFFSEETEAMEFSRSLQSLEEEAEKILSAEFFDASSLALLQEAREEQSVLKALPDFPPETSCAVLLEAASESEESIESLLFSLLELFPDEERTWASDSSVDRERFRSMRHSIPEKINQRIHSASSLDPRIHKLPLDLSGPSSQFSEYFHIYREAIRDSGISATICGHILENRLHVNFLPKDYQEFQRAQTLMEQVTDKILKMGGCLCAENGVGKIKQPLLRKYLSEEEYQLQKTIKEFFDPQHKLCMGNILLG
ncbi:MAG: FAD-binding oxidoreductase [Lachnospiraceae bacterium]|nr:FAD-binding oxidoreductase [Lachnospiraceae bacterium]